MIARLYRACARVSPGKVQIDHVTKLVLGKVGDTDRGLVSFDAYPLVGLGILQVAGKCVTHVNDGSFACACPRLYPRTGSTTRRHTLVREYRATAGAIL